MIKNITKDIRKGLFVDFFLLFFSLLSLSPSPHPRRPCGSKYELRKRRQYCLAGRQARWPVTLPSTCPDTQQSETECRTEMLGLIVQVSKNVFCSFIYGHVAVSRVGNLNDTAQILGRVFDRGLLVVGEIPPEWARAGSYYRDPLTHLRGGFYGPAGTTY